MILEVEYSGTDEICLAVYKVLVFRVEELCDLL